MSAKLIHRAIVSSAVMIASATSVAHAQFWYNPCACAQPVAQTCYQTVPVTEYRPTVRKVMKPVTETKYVEQPVTEYVPVTEQKTAEVPVVNYQNVTEYHTVQRNAGYWQTAYHPVAKMSPCQYDPTPTFGGWLNRNLYGLRAALTPNYIASRQFVPRTVTQTVPVTRQVAVRSTRQVTYNVTKYEPRQTTRRVAVNTTKFVEAEETVMSPVTVYRTVPTGTSIAYGFAPFGAATQTVLAPTPAAAPRSAANPDAFKRSSEPTRDAKNLKELDNNPVKRSSYDSTNDSNDPFFKNNSGAKLNTPAPEPPAAKAAPSIARVSRWRPTRTARSSGPNLIAPTVASR